MDVDPHPRHRGGASNLRSRLRILKMVRITNSPKLDNVVKRDESVKMAFSVAAVVDVGDAVEPTAKMAQAPKHLTANAPSSPKSKSYPRWKG